MARQGEQLLKMLSRFALSVNDFVEGKGDPPRPRPLCCAVWCCVWYHLIRVNWLCGVGWAGSDGGVEMEELCGGARSMYLFNEVCQFLTPIHDYLPACVCPCMCY